MRRDGLLRVGHGALQRATGWVTTLSHYMPDLLAVVTGVGESRHATDRTLGMAPAIVGGARLIAAGHRSP